MLDEPYVAAEPSSYGELYSQLAGLGKGPFVRLLARMLACEPTDEALQIFAQINPGKWTDAVAKLARVVGYSENHNIEVNHTHVHTLADSELAARLAALRAKLGRVAGQDVGQNTSKQAQQGEPKPTLLLADLRNTTNPIDVVLAD